MATRKGTSANDVISGLSTEMTIFGFNGNDVITTAITTGTGPVIYGGGGNDSITTTGSTDRLFGGTGSDTISSGAGADRVDGGSGNDSITVGDGADNVLGNIGNDTLTGGSGKQTMYGGAGNDSIASGTDATATNKHYLYGGIGADTISSAGSAGLNYIYGGADIDSITGSTSGKDTIVAGLGNNVITGGGASGANHANETVSYFGMLKGAADTILGGYAGVTVNLATSTSQTVSSANSVADTITFVDHLTGYSYNDTLTGNAYANKIVGGLGADLLDSGGTDTNTVNTTNNNGNDSLYGGYGADTIAVHTATYTAATISALSTSGVTAMVIEGGVGIDTLTFANVVGTSVSTLVPVSGLGVAVANLPTAPSGTYTQAAVGGVYVNLSSDISTGVNFKGSAGAGHIAGIEKLIGTGSTDYIVSVGSATIDGGAGNDTIVASQGGSGADVLRGGSGANFYDGTSSAAKDYFGVGNAGNISGGVSGETDTIYGFNNGSASQGDRLYIDISDWSGQGVNHTLVGVTGAGTTASPYGLAAASVIVNAAAVAGSDYGSTANSTFIYNSTNGKVFVDMDGSGTTYKAVEIATLDLNTFTTAHTASGAAVLDNTDFILVA